MYTLKNIDGIIFDMDGVLLDTERLMKTFWQQEADALSFGDITPVYMQCVGITDGLCKELFERSYPELCPFEAFQARATAKLQAHMQEHGVPVKPGAATLLKALKDAGWTVGLASSTYIATVRKELDQTGLLPYFDVVVGGDNVPRSKPAPDIYLQACAEAGADPLETFAVEDSHNGIRSAHAAGMKALMVPDLYRRPMTSVHFVPPSCLIFSQLRIIYYRRSLPCLKHHPSGPLCGPPKKI